MIKLLRLMLLFCVVGGLLVACGGDDEGDDDSRGSDNRSGSNVTLEPPPELNEVETCTPDDVEDWYEGAYFSLEEFIILSRRGAREADAANRDEMPPVIDRLVAKRDTILVTGTPATCEEVELTAITNEMVEEMQAVINEFQSFANGEISAERLGERVLPDIRDLERELTVLGETITPLY
jgi:hypothetical protein